MIRMQDNRMTMCNWETITKEKRKEATTTDFEQNRQRYTDEKAIGKRKEDDKQQQWTKFVFEH